MGYDLHITRRDWWANPKGPEISIDEWLAFARTSTEVESDSENPGDHNWIMSRHKRRWPLWWAHRGELYTKNPDEEAIAVLVRIAQALNARVLGDDDEVYGTDPQDPSVPVRR